MLDVLGSTLPAALGVTASVIPIIALIVILTSPRAKAIGPAFVIGWVVGVLVGLVGASLLGAAAGASDDGSAGDQGVNVMGLLIGALFLWLAYRSYGNRPTPGQPVEPPAWLNRVDQLGALQVFGLGLGLVIVNAKNLPLFAAIGGDVAQAGLTGGAWVATIAVLALLASLGALVPLLASLGALVPLLVSLRGGEATEARLARWRGWLVRHNAVITGTILALLGVSIAGNALSGLGQG